MSGGSIAKKILLWISQFFLFCFVLFVWLVFLIIKLLGILKVLMEIFFLEHLSELAFRLLCHVMYQKCTCSIFINFLNGLNDVLKKVLCKWGAFICEGLSFFQNFFFYLNRASNGLETFNLQFIQTNKV